MEGPAAAYQTLSQLVYKLLTAEQEYEATGSEETLKTVINTDWGLPYLPRASMEQRKSELLEQRAEPVPPRSVRSEEHTSELQSRFDLVCRLLLEKKNTDNIMS